MATRVILCDDHALIRRGIRDTLADAEDIEVVGEAGDYGEFPQRDIEVEAPEVMLAATTEGDDRWLALFLRLFRHAAD